MSWGEPVEATAPAHRAAPNDQHLLLLDPAAGILLGWSGLIVYTRGGVCTGKE